MSMMVDQTVSEDSKWGTLCQDVWRTNIEEDNVILDHWLLFSPVIHNNCSLLELQYLPHPSQST